MNWIVDELKKYQLDEKAKESETTGTVHKFEVKVSLDGTLMKTAVFAENLSRATKIAEKLYGKKNVKSRPVKK